VNNKVESSRTIKRIDDIELRWTRGFGKDAYQYLEVVRWDENTSSIKPYCYTLCSWTKDKEGWDLRFIGNRPFMYHNSELLFSLCKVGQAYLDADFEFEERAGCTSLTPHPQATVTAGSE